MNAVLLDRMVRKWQRILRIEDWDLDVRIVHATELGNDTGLCERSAALRFARIRISEPSQLSPSTPWFHRDVEITLVHEMIHVLMPPDRSDEAYSLCAEQGTDSLARALVALDRRKE